MLFPQIRLKLFRSRLLLIPALFIAFTSQIFTLSYSEKGTIEISGTASLQYSNYQYESRYSPSNSLNLRFAPAISYFFWPTIYFGLTTAGSFDYSKISGSSASSTLYGTIGGFAGKTFQLKESLFAYGQFELGTSYFTTSDALYYSNNFWYLSVATGLKIVYAPAIVNLGLIYEFDRFTGNGTLNTVASWGNSLRFSVGMSIYF